MNIIITYDLENLTSFHYRKKRHKINNIYFIRTKIKI